MKLATEFFYGNKISEYGIENGYLDYSTLSKAFDMVLSNDIMENTASIGYWDIIGGVDFDDDDYNYPDVYQNFIVSEKGAEILQEIGEIVYYNETLNLYVWGVTHWGTAWTHVLTNVPCNVGYENT